MHAMHGEGLMPNPIHFCHRLSVAGLVLLLASCAHLAPPPPPPPEPPAPQETIQPPGPAPVRVDETAMLPLLGYYQLLQRMTPAELGRERQILAAGPQTPSAQLRQAMLLGLPRTASDLPRALGLLENVLRSGTPAAASLQPLARVLAVNYQERQKLDAQNERLAQQLKESQRRSEELQEKLDALADIERSIPVRPGARKPSTGIQR